MRPDFDDLSATDIEPGERARLERVHELLVAAGPPPELSPTRLGRAPATPTARRPARDRCRARGRRIRAGRRPRGQRPQRRLRGADGRARRRRPSASASLTVFELDDAGNWPMELTVAGLTPRAGDRPFQLWLTRKRRARGALRRLRHGRRRIGGRPDERAVPLRRVRRLGRRPGGLRDAPPHDVSTPGSSAIVGAMGIGHVCGVRDPDRTGPDRDGSRAASDADRARARP